MPEAKTSKQLSAEEREMIMIEQGKGSSVRTIVRCLNRSASSISREIRRNTVPTRRDQVDTAERVGYDATQAARGYRERRKCCVRQPRLAVGGALYQYVHDRVIHDRWSPQQIAIRSEAHVSGLRLQAASHEPTYAAIYAYPRGGLKQASIEALGQEKPMRGRRRTSAAGPHYIPEALRIVHRPEEIEARLVPGHWEGDLIKGAFNRSAVGTLVERKTRFVVLARIEGCTATHALEGFSRQMKRLPAFLRQSPIYDCGSEMACHEALTQRLKMNVWFADPHAPWQRGSNENTNGLLRQFLPKGMDLSTVTQTQLNDIARLMNGRPRVALGDYTPDEVRARESPNIANVLNLTLEAADCNSN